MNAMAKRSGVLCWLCLSFFAAASYGQEPAGEGADPGVRQQADELEARRTELEARKAELQRVESQLKEAEATRKALTSDLEKLREDLLHRMAADKSADDLKRQTDDQSAERRDPRMVEAMKSAALGLAAAARSHRVPAEPERAVILTIVVGPDGREPLVFLVEEKVEKVADGALRRWEQLRRLEQETGIAAAIDAGVNAGRNIVIIKAEKNVAYEDVARVARLAARDSHVKLRFEVMDNEAGAAAPLGHNRAPASTAHDELRRDESTARDEPAQARTGGDVERAVDELRREVRQLREEIRDLRRWLERGAKPSDSSRLPPIGAPPDASNGRVGAREFVRVRSRHAGEVVRVGDASRPVRFGDHARKGDVLAVLWSRELAEQIGELADAQKRFELDQKIADQLKRLGDVGSVSAREVREAQRALDEDQLAIKTLKRALLLWPLGEATIAERLAGFDEEVTERQLKACGEFTLAAPADGAVVEQNVTVGDIVDPGDVLFQLELDADAGRETETN